jgi:hypothetical protein
VPESYQLSAVGEAVTELTEPDAKPLVVRKYWVTPASLTECAAFIVITGTLKEPDPALVTFVVTASTV